MTNFNKYLTQLFSPSDLICADDPTSRWYRQGGNWINLCLTMYVEMVRKPDNGEEIQNSVCCWSGIIMLLRIVKSTMNEADHEYNEDNLPHGTRALNEIVLPWAKMDSIICADSYFASVPSAE